MNARLKEWIIKQNDEGSRPNAINSFLRVLKDDPEKVLDVFARNIYKWAIDCMTELKIDISFGNSRAECQDLLEAFKKHYAKQLAEMDVPKEPMDDKFMAWVIAQHENFTKFEKQVFLRMLKCEPEKVLQVFLSNFTTWMFSYGAETGETSFTYNQNSDCQQLLEGMQKHFATQLAEIT